MFVANGDPVKAIEVEYTIPIDVLFASFKFLAEEKQREREQRRELYDIIATSHGMKFEWTTSSVPEQSKKPKSNAEFETKLAMMGFKVVTKDK